MIRLHKWFCNIYPYDFTFEKEFDTQMGEIICNEDPYLTIKFINKKFESTYIKFDDWWKQLSELKNSLNNIIVIV